MSTVPAPRHNRVLQVATLAMDCERGDIKRGQDKSESPRNIPTYPQVVHCASVPSTVCGRNSHHPSCLPVWLNFDDSLSATAMDGQVGRAPPRVCQDDLFGLPISARGKGFN